jgi:hypothetical protein
MRLLGRYRDRQGANFRLGAFHDQLIGYGSLPLSVIECLMFDDETSLRQAQRMGCSHCGESPAEGVAIAEPRPRGVPMSRPGSEAQKPRRCATKGYIGKLRTQRVAGAFDP